VIVIDASALAAFFLREEGWEKLVKYMKNTISSDLILKEFYSVLYKAVYFKRISIDEANTIIETFKSYSKFNMKLIQEDVYLDEAFKISLNYNVPIYDSLYIALALKENKPLLTLDKKQAEVAKELKIIVYA
jgi:Predicted nucleic acid-binding protein, contains PIN domain